MDELKAISELASLDSVKTRRAVRKGKVTRLRKPLEDLLATELRDLSTTKLQKLLEDLNREKRLFDSLQIRYEQLLEARDDVTPDQIEKEMVAGEEASEAIAELIHRAEELKSIHTLYLEANQILRNFDMIIKAPEATMDEMEKNCSKLQKRMSTLVAQAAVLRNSDDLAAVSKTVADSQTELYIYLNDAKKRSKETTDTKPPVTPTPIKLSRNSSLRLDLPNFTGYPLDWRHFRELFTSALERAGDDYSDREKHCFLLKAMKHSEAERIVKSHATSMDGYQKALKALENKFGSAKKVYPHLINKMALAETTSLTVQGLAQFRENFVLTCEAAEELGCTHIRQFAAAMGIATFDSPLRAEWTKFFKDATDVPTIDDLVNFLDPLESNMDTLDLPGKTVTQNRDGRPSSQTTPSRKSNNSKNSSCPLCKEQHGLFRCPVFLGYDPSRRQKYVKEKKGCTNCLALNHAASDCPSSYTCKECNGKHNTLLHLPSTNSTSSSTTTTNTTNLIALNDSSQPSTNQQVPPKVSFLHTAIAKAVNGDRNSDVRVAFDTGASSSLITESLASRLKLQRHPRRLTITGACGGGVSKHFVELTLHSTLNQADSITTKFNVVSSLPSAPPPTNIEAVKSEAHLKGLPLADLEFGGRLDILLGGVDLSNCVTGSLTKGASSDVAAQPTIFGWTVTGPLDHVPPQTSVFQIHIAEDNLQADLSRLWELDRTPELSHLSPNDEEVTQHFLDTHQIDSDGRYIVKLPRISNPPALGTSRNLAVRRFQQNEKSLNKKGKSAEFNAALSEYIQLDHAEEVPAADMANDHFYLPVHGVFKATSTTTKVRPVFDASAASSSGASLNDTLQQGPNLYPLLSDILLKFRRHNIGFSADISKMFREIKLHNDEKDFHRFIWRDDDGIIKDLRMNRLTFGVRCSPYVATQVIRHLAEKHAESHPEASRAILTSFYVDDYLSGASTIEEAVHIRTHLCQLLSIAGMTLRKWRTSDDSFKATIPEHIVETADLQISPGDKPIKALGIHWNVNNDKLSVSTPDIPADQPTTKRTIASNLGKVFDVLGLFSPYTITGKILLRKLWALQVGWDTEPPEAIVEQWSQWKSQLSLISSHQVPRKYSNSSDVITQTLHGFADASQEAYGAVVYLQQTFSDGTSDTSLIISKARVLPLKGLTIPRAELTAAYLLAKLLNYCSTQLNISVITAWSDSSIVLCWLRKAPNSLNTFVANRVHNIHKLVPNIPWRHISSASNPADMLSRGLQADSLIQSTLWWKGPPWINLPQQEWPAPQFEVPARIPEVKSVILSAPATPTPKIWETFSDYNQMIRILSWCRRFIFNCKTSASKRNKHPCLQSNEYKSTENKLFAQEQHETFPEAFNAISKDKPLPKGHAFRKFQLSLNEEEMLLLSTRVRDFQDPSQPRKLIALSLQSTLTRLFINNLHTRYLHPGSNTLLSIVNQDYYIPGIKNFLKGLSRKCARCQRAYDRGVHQSPGLLPSSRTMPAPPFSITGVDYAGPFITRKGHTRKPVMVKSYACLFICLTTKAIHIELCQDLSTEEFMAALRRFCSRRGTPEEIHSDNGTNFVGAHNEFQQVKQMLQSSKDSISDYACQHHIKWHFIPPRTPHMGGLWESAVKQMKLLMRKRLPAHRLKTDELASVLVEIEAILNSRPLTPIESTDPEVTTLTPGHFLIGRPLVAPHPGITSQAKISTLRRWQLTQRLTQDLWHDWKKQYLQSIQRQHGNNKSNHKFRIGEIVFLRDESMAYRQWPLARITATHPGSDGVIRVVDVLCQGKTLRRATVHLIPFMKEDGPSPPPPPPQYVQVCPSGD